MINFHKVDGLSFENGKMKITIDAKAYEFELQNISSRLLNASQEERMNYEVSPSGYGIHWPLIDEDLSVEGLLHS